MLLPETVTAYIAARLAADSAPVWARLSSEDEAAHRMRELLAACFGASVALDAALIAHAPDYVRAQAERWAGMVARIPLPPHVQVYRIEHAPPRPQHCERALHGAAVIIVGDGRWYVWEVRGANAAQVTTGYDGWRSVTDFVDSHLDGYVLTERRPSGIEGEHFAAAVEQALRSIAEPAKEPEPIVILGPWRQHPSGTWYRPHHGTTNEGATVKHGGWALHSNRPPNAHLWPAIVRGDGGKDDADREARERGWVLLDDMPLCPLGPLKPWGGDISGRRYRAYHHGSEVWAAVHVGEDGWWVTTIPLRHRLDRPAAHGPQTGPEGERLAMAAALALGFVEGAQ